jgi:hypothetical protein
VLDFLIGALDNQVHSGATNWVVAEKLKRAWQAGLLTDDQYLTAHNLMAQGQYKEMQEYLDGLRKARQ